MALSVSKVAWTHSKAKGNALLTLLALADHAGEEKVKHGEPALAFPSQNRVAKMINCSRSTVERALDDLAQRGEIVDTGERRLRGTVVWELFPEVDLTDVGSSYDEVTDSGSGDGVRSSDLTHSGNDLTHLHSDLTDSEQRPASPMTHKPVEPEEDQVKPENEHGSGSPSAAPDFSLPQSTNNGNSNTLDPSLLADLEAQLPGSKGPLREATERSIARMREEFDIESEVTVWADPQRLATLAGVELTQLAGATA